jgi:predicted RNase H-like HicB family nuclease
MRFPVVIHKDPDSDYGVTVPDLPGCFSAGESLDDALAQAVEAIELHLEGMLLDKEPLPRLQRIEVHQQNPDYREGIWGYIAAHRVAEA